MVFFGKEILYRIRIQNRAKVHNVNKVKTAITAWGVSVSSAEQRSTMLAKIIIAILVVAGVINALIVYSSCVVAGCADEACSSNILFITYKKRCISKWNRKRR